ALFPGAYGDSLSSFNDVLDQLTWHARETAAVAHALERGELAQSMPLSTPDGMPLRGQALRVALSMNALVARLRAIRSEVIRSEGKLGGQAGVKGVSGVWKDLTDNVNFMASNLTTQVRSIIRVVTAVANGNLNEKLQVNARGEIAALGETLNAMTTTLSILAQQVTSVARTVAAEGTPGATAQV